MSLLEINNLEAGYGEIHILHNVSLSIEPSTINVLMGPNGAGKSTLLKSLFSLTQIYSGVIRYNGEDITNVSPSALLQKGIAFVSQGRINFSTLSVEDNLILGVPYIKDMSEVRKRMEDMYSIFPVLKQKRKVLAYALSGGEQQMLAIARALMSKPTLLLMDEPSLGLSPKLVKEVFAYIADIRVRFGTTIVVVEHNIKSLMDIADYGAILVNGSIIAYAPCFELKQNPLMKQVFVGALE